MHSGNNKHSHAKESLRIKTWMLLFLLWSSALFSQKAFIPEPSLNVISDYQNLLSEEEKSLLAKQIKEEYNANSNQLMVVSIPTKYLGDVPVEDYAQQLFEKWQPGQKGLDNGVLIIIAGSKYDSVGRKLRIHTGYGLEGVLPDILCSKIERELMVPELKRGNYFKAIKNGSASILNFISKENIGKAPKYKVAPVKSGDRVFDYARIFSDKEKEQLEKELDGSFNFNNRVIVTELNYSYPSSFAYISSQYTYDTTLMKISFNPGYYTDAADSTLKLDESRKNYYLSYYSNGYEDKFSDYDKVYEAQIVLAKDIDKNGIYNTCMNLIAEEKATYAMQMKRFVTFLCYLFSITAILFVIFYFTKKFKGSSKKKKPAAIRIVLGTLLILINIYSIMSLATFEMLYYLLFEKETGLSAFVTVAWMVLLGASHVINIILVYKIDANYFNSKLFSWIGKGGGGGESSYSGSSNSSSSYSSSSSSSSSSSGSGSSNGGYYGGGGRSGGGGASSDW
jgi:uncharacterized membrane protein YgcG